MKPVISESQRANRSIMIRTVLLMLVFGIAAFAPVVMKLYQVQIIDHDKYEENAVKQQTRDTVIAPARGTIYDRNMKTLAVSASVNTVVVVPNLIMDDEKSDEKRKLISEGLANILELDTNSISEKIVNNKTKAYAAIKQKIEQDVSEEIRTFISENKLESMVRLDPDTKRYYPNGNFAANTLGFVSSDGVGIEGLELQYNEQLTGTPGRIVSTRENRGATLPLQYEKYYDASNGLNAVLTLDETIQHFLEKHLAAAVIENQVSKRAMGIVMDVKTGGILAIATSQSFDPNNRTEITDPAVQEELAGLEGDELAAKRNEALAAQYRNKAVSDTYDPGSTFKIVTAAIALEEKAVKMDDRFSCSGSIMVKGWGKPMHCHKRIGHGAESFLEGIQNSCNPVFITVALRVGRQVFWDYMHAFGFYEKTNVDIPGESNSIMASWEEYNRSDVTLATYAFGQTFTVTPIQLITAISAVANDGKMMWPHIVKEFTDSTGTVVEEVQPKVVRQVVSEETANLVCSALEEVVRVGTGKNAYVAGYNIGGKTGTSQKKNLAESEQEGKYIVSFAGVAPIDDPQIVLLIAMDEPGGPVNMRSGGQMAAPVAGRIMADILPYLGIKAQYTADDVAGKELTSPTLKELTVDEAIAVLKANDLKYRIEGEGEKIIDQLPVAGIIVPATAQYVLYTETEKPDELVTVPNVVGKTPEQANALIVNAGLYMRVSGATSTYSSTIEATSQDVKAGESVALGTVVSVEFRDISIKD